jgi:pyruvate dehydrogenase E2 component (dihydrolipoamide acetyltransferase)
MEVIMKMPDLSTTDSAIKLVRWLVEPGQVVKRGQSLCEIETDKAASEVESAFNGVLKELGAQAGESVVVGQNLAVFETDAPPGTFPSTTPASGKGPGLFARNRLATQPSSPVSPSAASPAISLSQTQQTLGRRLQASKQNVPHFYLQASASAEPMIRRRNAASPKPVWEAFFAFAISKVLKDFERIRWRVGKENVSLAPNSDIGVAVDLKGELFVAAIHVPPDASVEKISADIRARVGEIEQSVAETRAVKPAAITITNLGASCVESFAAIINPPETAILAIGKIGPVPVVQNGQVAVQNRVFLTLSADHRVVNGKYAAEFLSAVIHEIESF